jgi:hypothetical protein
MLRRARRPKRVGRRVAELGCVVGLTCLIGASTVNAGSTASSPCPGVPFAPPPAGAPPAPSVQCGPGLVSIGNIGAPLSTVTSVPNGPKPVGAFPIPSTAAARKLTSVSGASGAASSTTCANDYGYGYLWSYVSTGNPASLGNEQTAVSGVGVTSLGSIEHNAVALVSWQTTHGPNNYWVQMGYVRGNMPGWTDNLGSGQEAIYLEFNTSTAYQFYPLAAANDGTRHNFDMTEDASGHYYNFYLDGVLKWANVYQAYPATVAIYGNEDYNVDGVCEPGYADNNLFTLPVSNVHVDPGHALGTAGSTGPWQSDGDTTESSLPGLGYTCGSNSNGYFWWCG